MYIRGLIPWNFAELAEAVPIDMSSHVLLNLLNSLRKRDKMLGLPSILLLFRNDFDKFNNTEFY